MPHAEFIQHVAYHRIEPWGDDWQQAGTMAWASVAPHVKRRMRPRDFIPDSRKDEGASLGGMFASMKEIATLKAQVSG